MVSLVEQAQKHQGQISQVNIKNLEKELASAAELNKINCELCNAESELDEERQMQLLKLFVAWLKRRVKRNKRLAGSNDYALANDALKQRRKYLHSLQRGAKRKATLERIDDRAKKAKINIELDPFFQFEMAGKPLTLDVLSDIFSFVPAQFASGETWSAPRFLRHRFLFDAGRVKLPPYSCLELRAVCKTFFYCYHDRSPQFWRMPTRLFLDNAGLRNNSLEEWGVAYPSDCWARRLLIYRYYKSQNEDEQQKLMEQKAIHQENLDDNLRPHVTPGPVFKRCLKMAEALMCCIPLELFNPKCLLMIDSQLPEGVMKQLFDLNEIGLTILQCRRVSMEYSKVSGKFSFDAYNLHLTDSDRSIHEVFDYRSMDRLEILKRVAPTVEKLCTTDSRTSFLLGLKKIKSIIFPRLEYFRTSPSWQYHFCEIHNEPSLTERWKKTFPNLKKKHYEETETYRGASNSRSSLVAALSFSCAHRWYSPLGRSIPYYGNHGKVKTRRLVAQGHLIKKVEPMFA